MSETKHLKCPCQKCGASIEFPAHGVGSSVSCPHCGERTTLFAAPEPAEEIPESTATEERPRSRALPMAISAVLLLALGGTLFAFRERFTGSKPADAEGTAAPVASPTPGRKDSESTQAVSPASTPKTPKSPDDLKVGAITLEKAKGSSLVYAIGVLRNESDHQRFGVNIEVELKDTKGARAGVAKDYRSVIEPRQEWRFRALVLDTKAASAKLSKIREEE